jgi:hypothetical protein
MEKEFLLRLVKTSAPARIWGGLASVALFLGFGWLINTQNISTGRLMLIMMPTALVVYLLARRFLTYEALATVEENRVLLQPLKTPAATVIAFDEVVSFSLEKTSKTEVLRFELSDGTRRELDGKGSAGDNFADFVRAVDLAAARYRIRHPSRMTRGWGFEDVPEPGV